MNKIIEEIIERNKPLWFINHIQAHLKPEDKVICKICGKSVDEIAEETWLKYFTEIKELKKRD